MDLEYWELSKNLKVIDCGKSKFKGGK